MEITSESFSPSHQPNKAEVLEVHSILRRLCAYHDRLSVGDRRFLSSWRARCCREAFRLRVGQNRLAVLRRVVARYEQPQLEAASLPCASKPKRKTKAKGANAHA